MADAKFYLKNPKSPDPSTGKCFIFLHKRYSGNRFVFYTARSIEPKHWDGFLNSNIKSSVKGAAALRRYLTDLQEKCEEIYTNELKKGIPHPKTLKAELKKYLN